MLLGRYCRASAHREISVPSVTGERKDDAFLSCWETFRMKDTYLRSRVRETGAPFECVNLHRRGASNRDGGGFSYLDTGPANAKTSHLHQVRN